MKIFLSEYTYLIIRRCVVQKLCVAKNCIPPGLSIANLRYSKILALFKRYYTRTFWFLTTIQYQNVLFVRHFQKGSHFRSPKTDENNINSLVPRTFSIQSLCSLALTVLLRDNIRGVVSLLVVGSRLRVDMPNVILRFLDRHRLLLCRQLGVLHTTTNVARTRLGVFELAPRRGRLVGRRQAVDLLRWRRALVVRDG